MDCIYLDKMNKNNSVVRYNPHCERVSIKSQRNISELEFIQTLFTKRAMEESDTLNETRDIQVLWVDSKDYETLVKKASQLCDKRLELVHKTYTCTKLDDDELEDQLDSLSELIQIRRFLKRYVEARKNKKYKDYAYFILA